MRTLLASALLLLACGCADRSSRPSGAGATPSIPGGPDAVVLRIPRAGGTVSAHAYPSIDSVIWRSQYRSPAIAQLIAFGPDDGYIAGIDTSGAPVRLDLRLGTITRMRGDALTAIASRDGSAIYALNRAGELTRFTPSGGDWKVRFPLPASALMPQGDGSVIVAGAQGDRMLFWRVRPPNDSVSDSVTVTAGGESAALSRTIAATAGTVGDRVYTGGSESVFAISARDLKVTLNVDVGDPVLAMAFTPSGDRIFVALDDAKALRIVDRFEEAVTGKVKLPGQPRELRMDPLGRVLLVHGGGDTTWVVSVAEGDVEGTLQTPWRSDLPMVMADGRIATVRGDDVILVNGTTLADDRTIAKGARDFWYAIRWNGFRPRASGLDEPVEFRNSAPRDTFDSAAHAGDTLAPPGGIPPAPPSTASPDKRAPVAPLPPKAAPPATTAPRGSTRTAARTAPAGKFTVSFATVLNERQAQSVARRIKVDGKSPRVVTSDRAGRTIYRVILGPYPTRAEAERVGRASRTNYWVFEGVP